MALTFYMDQHVPKAITVGLRLRGVDVVTAYEDGATELQDPELLERAFTIFYKEVRFRIALRILLSIKAEPRMTIFVTVILTELQPLGYCVSLAQICL